MDELIAQQAKLAKPGYRNTVPKFNFDEVFANEPLESQFPNIVHEDEDEIPDFMEPPVEGPHLSIRQFRILKQKYELYLEKKKDDLIAEGPIIQSECEDFLCNSCKVTIEEIGNL